MRLLRQRHVVFLILSHACIFAIIKQYGLLTSDYFRKAHHDGSMMLIPRRGAPITFVLAGHANGTAPERIILDGDTATQQEQQEHVINTQHEENECTPKPWQTVTHANCNDMHSLSMGDLLVQGAFNQHHQRGLFEIFGSGGSRITGKLGMNDHEIVIYKTSRYNKELDEKRFQRGRREVVAMEILPGSATDIHGFCGFSSLTEFGDGGNLYHVVKRRRKQEGFQLDPLTKLNYAVEISRAVSRVHSIDNDYATLIHKDLDPTNVVMSRGRLKLIDFHASLFVEWNATGNLPCLPSRQEPNQNYDARSPEEISRGVLTEKMDVYGLGSILFFILTNGKRLYHCERPKGVCNDGIQDNTVSQDEIRDLKMNGTLPTFPNDMSEDPASKAIRDAVLQAVLPFPKERPSASEIVQQLERVQQSLTAVS